MSHLPPITNMPAHLEEPVMRDMPPIIPITKPLMSPPSAPTLAPSSVALSFAFDAVAKTLNVVIRDERSGDVVRTIEYTRIPADLHQNDKLNGLLLNQFA